MRLFWLLGHTGKAIAQRMGRDRKTVCATIRERGLDAPEGPFEMAWLVMKRELDAMAEALAGGGEVDTAKMLRLAAELRHTEAAMRAAARDVLEDEADAGEADDAQGIWERLEAVEQQRRLDAAGLPAEGAGDSAGFEQSDAGDAGLPETKSVYLRSPRYAGSTAGPLADMAVHGRARRRQDAGGG
ncbi:hypothetical protein [Hyphomonas johnsonii]|uniref:Uncharacterized protein n=1 Tax=Hyphomonas johnsonii MHS-2 TaxID=1280950 RepID=A0A059FSU6_9PROT|nr:hypothetical protein [Hyphomonas johnsonii]KCZ93770.1 hypothetical protein HJO_00300 [Hyphomonas johnsonii MHS-2]